MKRLLFALKTIYLNKVLNSDIWNHTITFFSPPGREVRTCHPIAKKKSERM